MSERLMMSEEECRKKVKELLQIPKEDLLTKYMFQEQEIERLNNVIHEIEEYTHERIKLYKKRLKFPFYHPMRTLHNIWLYERYLSKLKKYKGGVDNE